MRVAVDGRNTPLQLLQGGWLERATVQNCVPHGPVRPRERSNHPSLATGVNLGPTHDRATTKSQNRYSLIKMDVPRCHVSIDNLVLCSSISVLDSGYPLVLIVDLKESFTSPQFAKPSRRTAHLRSAVALCFSHMCCRMHCDSAECLGFLYLF